MSHKKICKSFEMMKSYYLFFRIQTNQTMESSTSYNFSTPTVSIKNQSFLVILDQIFGVSDVI